MFRYFWFIIKSAGEDFRRNKVRTFLTSLGILIGVSSVVLLTAFGLGLKAFIEGQFESLGTNLIIVFPGKIFENGQFRQGGAAVAVASFDERDLTTLKRIRSAQYVIPVFTKTLKIDGPEDSRFADVFISSADIFPARNLTASLGRVFERSDVEKRSKVVVMGPKIADKLFGDKSQAVGRTITIDSQGFRVVGVLDEKGGGGFGGPDFDSFVYMPYKSAASFNPDKKFIALYVKAKSKDLVETAKTETETLMLKRYNEDDFSLAEQTEILNAINSIFGVINIVLVGVAAISLVVGGIGIMNIMYVSVVERIREIGIRRAIGARKADILWQFLAEAVLLSLLGGILGLGFSYLIVLIVQRFFPAYINFESVALALGVSSGIGIIFGVFPAKKAADLSPIDAIRYE